MELASSKLSGFYIFDFFELFLLRWTYIPHHKEGYFCEEGGHCIFEDAYFCVVVVVFLILVEFVVRWQILFTVLGRGLEEFESYEIVQAGRGMRLPCFKRVVEALGGLSNFLIILLLDFWNYWPGRRVNFEFVYHLRSSESWGKSL